MEPFARLYQCARCHHQVVICSECDRGNLYCAGGCARAARTGSLRAAGRRFLFGRGSRRHRRVPCRCGGVPRTIGGPRSALQGCRRPSGARPTTARTQNAAPAADHSPVSHTRSPSRQAGH